MLLVVPAVYGMHGFLNQNNYAIKVPKPLAALGSLIFLMGEIGNGYHHHLLAGFRKEPKTEFNTSSNGKYIFPHGGLFEYVSTPHYLFELVTWFGWGILNSFSRGSVVLLSISTTFLIPASLEKHARNKNDFKQWPKERKALVPFIL